MQRITNCILKQGNEILMLKKPRRDWYCAPGGKMEPGEHIRGSVTREFQEETGLTLLHPELRGVFTFVIKEDGQQFKEWMMFTFYCESSEGERLDVSQEGELEWVPVSEVLQKDMAEGDRHIFQHVLTSNEIIYGTFTYTTDFTLLSVELDINGV
ncbi:NUDIX hydrolase [Salirhabdus salicampi]|uniref:NUDIX hydrolase n=1 Tax=Salirhabdus salicampi TaxID=476102 RepID=UPI0020C24330|nr:8-oxo-dGTP diphosphatase [Salirhabdus salicampi]MCP8617642.1 8-oxo-dGTP diphosphatase [Salirhabdus salicampi]